MSLPDFFKSIGESSYEFMERMSSQEDGSRKNDHMHKIEEFLVNANKRNVFESYQKICDYADNCLVKILTDLSNISG